jgi:hypothetical protein
MKDAAQRCSNPPIVAAVMQGPGGVLAAVTDPETRAMVCRTAGPTRCSAARSRASLRTGATNLGRSYSALLSLDYLGRAREQRRGHLKVECPGGFEVQNKVELYRSLHCKITRPFSFKKVVDV